MMGPKELSPLPLLLPDKPSIAVLPFQNMSGDPEQEYFADGMVEEITRYGKALKCLRLSAYIETYHTPSLLQVNRAGSCSACGSGSRPRSHIEKNCLNIGSWAQAHNRPLAAR